MSIYKAAQKSLTAADSAVIKLYLPFGSNEHLIRLTPSVDWEFSFDNDTLTAGKGMPLASGESYTIDSPVGDKTIMYVRQTSGGPVDIRWAYLTPSDRTAWR